MIPPDPTTALRVRLLKASVAIYIACEKPVAEQVSELLREAAAALGVSPKTDKEEAVGASLRCLRRYLDTLTITSENIGDVRRSLFSSSNSPWNAWVRDETAARENKPGAGVSGEARKESD